MTQVPVQYNLTSDADLEAKLSSKGLKVLELYSEWAGPCRSVLPTFKRIRTEKEDEDALLFLTMCAEKCDFLEIAKERRGRSEPLFLFYRNGALKVRVAGANTPALATSIQELTPPNADVDDLEENPIYLAKINREKGGGADAAAKEANKKRR